MKPEIYDKMVERVGKAKVDRIVGLVDAQAAFMEEKRLQGLAHEKRKLEKIMPKDDLIGGEYYTGFRYRGKHVAMWDGKKKVFLTFNYQFGYFLEELPYFLDVIDTNLDGFIPFAIINEIIID